MSRQIELVLSDKIPPGLLGTGPFARGQYQADTQSLYPKQCPLQSKHDTVEQTLGILREAAVRKLLGEDNHGFISQDKQPIITSHIVMIS